MNEHEPSDEMNPILAPESMVLRTRVRRRRTITLVVCVVIVALLILFWTQLLTPAQNHSASSAANISSHGFEDTHSLLLGKLAPDFTLNVLNGASGYPTIHLRALKGKSIVLNFWASWCGPCNDEAPFLQKSWMNLKARGVVFVGIDGSEKTSDALKFMHGYGIAYPNVQDTVTSATATDYGVTGLPETVFINREGIVVAKWIAPLTAQGLQYEMTKLV